MRAFWIARFVDKVTNCRYIITLGCLTGGLACRFAGSPAEGRLEGRGKMDDVIVVGGRCAGAPTAMLLARAGLKVRLIERSPELGDIISGQVIQVAGVARLRAWGLLDAVLATGCHPILGSKNWVDGQLFTMPPDGSPASPEALHGPFLIAPRRGALDPVLLEGASQAGAVVQLGVSVRGLLTDGPRVTGVSTEHGDYSARLVIGADGRNSRIAKLVNAPKYIDMASTTYSYIAFWKDCPVPEICLFWGSGQLTILIPTNDNLTLVGFQGPHTEFDTARRDPAQNYLSILKSQPAVMELLARGTIAESLRGTGDLPTFFRVSAGPGWALAGDAGHHKDPVMARGITDAFRDAELIADAATTGWDHDLDKAVAEYPALRDKCSRPLASVNDFVATGLGYMPGNMLLQTFLGLGELSNFLDPPRESVNEGS